MAENTKIEWATHTWNPWLGCTKVSPACDHCYAEDLMARRYGRVTWGAGEDRKRTSAANWREPLKWDRAAAAAGETATVFCLSLGDIWDNEIDPLWRREAFAVMEQTPNLLYLLLSKRIGNARRMCDPMAGNPVLPNNAALGATMIDQEEWDRDIGKLLEAGFVLGARFTFASVEPMLGPINARGELPSWVIVGGESGHGARPMHPNWARSLRDQCQTAGVPYFFKQWGEWRSDVGAKTPVSLDRLRHIRGDGRIATADEIGDIKRREGHQDWRQIARVGKKTAGRLLDGREWNEILA